jgi:hypothetical protein
MPLRGKLATADGRDGGQEGGTYWSVNDSVLVGVFWFPDGGHAFSRGWPLNRLTMNRDGVEVRPSTWLGGPRLSYAWNEIARVERTRRGLRFRFKERGKTFVVGKPWGGDRLARNAQSLCPERFDPVVHPVTTWRWDPAE